MSENITEKPDNKEFYGAFVRYQCFCRLYQ